MRVRARVTGCGGRGWRELGKVPWQCGERRRQRVLEQRLEEPGEG